MNELQNQRSFESPDPMLRGDGPLLPSAPVSQGENGSQLNEQQVRLNHERELVTSIQDKLGLNSTTQEAPVFPEAHIVQENTASVSTSAHQAVPEDWMLLTEEERRKLASSATIVKHSIERGYLLDQCSIAFYSLAEVSPDAFMASILNPDKLRMFLPNYKSLSFGKVEEKDLGAVTSFQLSYELFLDVKDQSKVKKIDVACLLAPVKPRGYQFTFQKGDTWNSGDFRGEIKIIPCQGKMLIHYKVSASVAKPLMVFYTEHQKQKITAGLEQLFKRLLSLTNKKLSDRDGQIISNLRRLHESE